MLDTAQPSNNSSTIHSPIVALGKLKLVSYTYKQNLKKKVKKCKDINLGISLVKI